MIVVHYTCILMCLYIFCLYVNICKKYIHRSHINYSTMINKMNVTRCLNNYSEFLELLVKLVGKPIVELDYC
ncbi:hypothetical protein L1987_09851 [Smallanthus sonchifolius]|uniref:Uncharacterized protein n=1 Tax=Smallanthus sonchifolius TaxID=185202 RepID=A0ACB9JQG5_9ASTR|nr:hypothetical protein L1987_09851 [Smallanthus sonchifolius]